MVNILQAGGGAAVVIEIETEVGTTEEEIGTEIGDMTEVMIVTEIETETGMMIEPALLLGIRKCL